MIELADVDSCESCHAAQVEQWQGSLFDYRGAYFAATQGLLSEPRHSDLLRLQALALRELDVPAEWQEAARQAFRRFRHDEEAPRLRSQCSDTDEHCLLERNSVHVHVLEPAP